MSRTAEPWRRKRRDGQLGPWYAWVNRKQEWLAPAAATKTDARKALFALLGGPKRPPAPRGVALVRDVLAAFLVRQGERWEAGEIEAGTLLHYRDVLRPAEQAIGDRLASEVDGEAVTRWAGSRPSWGAARRRAAVQAVRAAFRHAARKGLMDRDPLADLKPPPAVRREFDATAKVRDRLAADAKDQAWGEFLFAVAETGCRPGEVAGVSASDFDPEAGTWTVKNKTRRKTGREMRTVFLTAKLVELCKRLAESRPTGPLFLNAFGRPWKRHAWGGRMRRSRQRLGLPDGLVCYSLRHGWITDAIEAGVNPVIVAEQAGHRTTDMISSVYSKVAQRRDVMRQAVEQVRPAPSPSIAEKAHRSRATTMARKPEPDASQPPAPRPPALPGPANKRRPGRR